MHILWDIEKKHGRFRPILKIRIDIPAWAKKLNISTPSIKTPWREDIYSDNTNFHNDKPHKNTWKRFHKLELFSGQEKMIYLPYRGEHATPADYRDVEIIMRAFQRKIDKNVANAYKSSSWGCSGETEIGMETKELIAPHVAKSKMLKRVA